MTSTFLTWYSLPSICIAIISQYGFGRSIHCKIYIANYKPTIPLTDFKSNHHIWKWKVKVKSLSCFWLFVAPWTVACQIPPCMESSRPPRFLCSWNLPDKDTGVGCHFLLRGMFLTKGSNLGLPQCRQTLLWAIREVPTFCQLTLNQIITYMVS